MPSEWQSAPQNTRERFPEIEARIGEDPARFLDRPLFEADSDGSSPMLLAKARIRGIDYLDVIDAWFEVEISLDRGPRKRVIGLLNRRKQELKEAGERSKRCNEYRMYEPTASSAIWTDYDDGEQLTWKYTRQNQRTLTDGGDQ